MHAVDQQVLRLAGALAWVAEDLRVAAQKGPWDDRLAARADVLSDIVVDFSGATEMDRRLTGLGRGPDRHAIELRTAARAATTATDSVVEIFSRSGEHPTQADTDSVMSLLTALVRMSEVARNSVLRNWITTSLWRRPSQTGDYR